MTEVRTPSEDDRERVFDVLRVSLSFGTAQQPARVARLPLPKMRCVVEDDSGLATRAVTELLHAARAKGQPISALYPAIDLERDLEDVRACYRASVADHTGPIDSAGPSPWMHDFF